MKMNKNETQMRLTKQARMTSDVSRSPDKLKTLYLPYHNAFGHYTWPDGNLPLMAPAHEVRWSFHHVFLEDHMTN